MLAVFFLAPVLGAIADYSALKKKFLFFFCVLGCLFTGLLFLCVEGDYWLAALFFILANVGFAAGNTFYNALLQEISSSETVGRISGFGWAVGYIGGGLLLALNLAMIEKPQWFHLSREAHFPVRVSILSVSVWWAIFSIPIFLWVKERGIARPSLKMKDFLVIGIKNVIDTFRSVRRHKEIFKYLIAYLIYNDGIETVIVMASIFGAKELGMLEGELVLCFLMIQGIAFFGALFFGVLSDKIGHKISIGMTLVIYLLVCFWAVVMKTKFEFWILGAIIAIVLGGSQAASRSLLALLAPKENSAQFFGFFALTGKLSTVIGPFVFAFLSQIYSLRVAVGGLSFFFVAGLVILYFVKEPKQNELVTA